MNNQSMANRTKNLRSGKNEVVVQVASNPAEKQEIYRFRYLVHVEDSKKQSTAGDVSQGNICDSIDEQSLLVYAQDSTGIVGTLRLTFGKAQEFPDTLFTIFRLERFQLPLYENAGPIIGVAARLAIKSSYRGSQVLYLLMVKAYELFREHHAEYIFGGCNPYLIPLYEKMGFRKFVPNFVDPGNGLLVPLVMAIANISHLRAVRSPFYRIACKFPNDAQSEKKFLQLFPEVLLHINTYLVSQAELWEIVIQKLRKSPLRAMPLLNRLSQQEASAFLHLGTLVSCMQGEYIVHYGEVSNEIFIVLSGAVLGETKDHSRIVHPGQSFGGIGLGNNPGPQDETMMAIINSEILVVSRHYFEKFKRLYSKAALQILHNLESILN
jgi:predicted GNAT family N-acyltransferase